LRSGGLGIRFVDYPQTEHDGVDTIIAPARNTTKWTTKPAVLVEFDPTSGLALIYVCCQKVVAANPIRTRPTANAPAYRPKSARDRGSESSSDVSQALSRAQAKHVRTVPPRGE